MALASTRRLSQRQDKVYNRYCRLTPTVYNAKMLLLNVRRNFSSDQVFKRLVLPVGDNWRFRIYLTESIALSYKLPTRMAATRSSFGQLEIDPCSPESLQ